MLSPGWIREVMLALVNLACHFPFYLLLALDCQSRLLYCVLWLRLLSTAAKSF